jgi:hypothetical protein
MYDTENYSESNREATITGPHPEYDRYGRSTGVCYYHCSRRGVEALHVVEFRTTSKQRDTVAEHVLVTILSRTDTDPAGVRDTIRSAVVEGQLVERDGRYAVVELLASHWSKIGSQAGRER